MAGPAYPPYLPIQSVDAHNITLASYVYSPDPVGRQQGVVEQHLNRSVLWGYDAAGRLTSENITDPANGSKVVTYVYDSAGNRSSRVDSAAGSTRYSYDADDHLLTEAGPPGTTTYSYDLNGNVTQKAGAGGTTIFGYDARNLQTSVTIGANSYTYEYDVDGARTASVLNGARTNFLVDRNWENAQVILETDETGAEVEHHVFGREEVLGSLGAAQGVRYMLYDGQRSVRAQTGSTGTLTDSLTFDAFGQRLATSGSSPETFGFSGEQPEFETGLLYLRARRYDPSTGRFLGIDPLSLPSSSRPTALNRFIYASDDPVGVRDPSGEEGEGGGGENGFGAGVEVAQAIPAIPGSKPGVRNLRAALGVAEMNQVVENAKANILKLMVSFTAADYQKYFDKKATPNVSVTGVTGVFDQIMKKFDDPTVIHLFPSDPGYVPGPGNAHVTGNNLYYGPNAVSLAMNQPTLAEAMVVHEHKHLVMPDRPDYPPQFGSQSADAATYWESYPNIAIKFAKNYEMAYSYKMLQDGFDPPWWN